MLTLNIHQAMSDIKTDNMVRKKLLSSFVNLAQFEEDANIGQQDSLAHITDYNLKFGTLSNVSSAQTSLDNVYQKWINFCVKEDPEICDDYINNLNSILEELEKNNHKDYICNDKIMEFKCKAEESKELHNKYITARENYGKKSYCSHKLDEMKQLEIKELYNDFQEAQKDYVEKESEILNMLKNYETWRQNSLIKCSMNFILSNIEYHGKAVEEQSSVMGTFEESEKDIYVKNRFGNRFLKEVPKKI